MAIETQLQLGVGEGESLDHHDHHHQKGGAGGNFRRVGTIGGRRVLMFDGRLWVPNNRQGRGLVAALTGKVYGASAGKYLEISHDSLVEVRADLDDLIALLRTVWQASNPLPQDSAVHMLLLECGVREPMAAHLAADPWVTIERVASWRHQFAQESKVSRQRVGPGLLILKLREHREPPRIHREEGDWQRFLDGPYAGDIDH